MVLTATTLEEEALRLAKLRALMVLDSEAEPLFDSLARMASEVCRAPIALVSLIDEQRQWFKANVGLAGVRETPREYAFCDYAIRGGGVMVVPDAQGDERFARNPLVTGEPGIRFYAGAPLVMSGGERMGTLCVIDRQARRLSPEQAGMLEQLAGLVAQALEMRELLLVRAMAVRDEQERQLAENEARWRAILDAQSELVAQATPDGRLLYANPAYARHFGSSVGRIVGTSMYDYIHPGDHAIVRDRVEWVLATGRNLTSENRMQLASGEECWISWTNTRQLDAAGRPLLHSTGRDITARMRAERALRQSQAMLARTGRVAGVGGWELDIATGQVTWTDETRRLHEVPDDHQPTLDSALDFYEPGSREVIERAVQAGLSRGQPWDLELQLHTARGRRIWARAVGEVEFENGRPVRLFGAFQDITETRRLRQQVEDSERFLRQLTDSLPVRLAYLDCERRYRYVNARWCLDTGVGAEAALGRTRAELFPQRDDGLMSERAQAALDGHPQQFEFDETVDGQSRRLENRLTPNRDADGRVLGFFVAGIDITARSQAERSLREVVAIIDNTTDFVIQADRERRVRYMNPAAARAMLGRPWQAGEDFFVRDLLPESTHRLFANEILPALQAGRVWLGQSHAYLAGRHEVPVSHMVIAHRDAAGEIERYSVVMRDISQFMAAQAEKERQAATMRSVANAIPSTVAVVDAAGRYAFVNRAFEVAVGRPAAQIVGHPAQEVLGDAEFERRRPWIRQALAGHAVRFELDHPGAHGRAYTAFDYLPLLTSAGQPDGFVVVSQDITAQKLEAARLQLLSQTDALTGLLNRAGFQQSLQQLLYEGDGGWFAVLYIDLDRFKPVNDTHGHAAGDALLQQVATRLSRLIRPSDTVARLGGDEFAVVLPGVREAAQAERVAQGIVDAMRLPFTLPGGIVVTIGASVGGAVGTTSKDGQWADLLERADRMLYRAKGAGRDRMEVAGPPG